MKSLVEEGIAADAEDGRPVPSGLQTLDYILDGGYARNRVHLLEGKPGSGKTTLALQFLVEAARVGGRCLYVTLSESRAELQTVAESHGFSLTGITIFELSPPEMTLEGEREQTVLYYADLELGETVRLIQGAFEKYAPTYLVFDSLSEIRLLSQNVLRYRRQVLALKNFFTSRGCTTIFLDDITREEDDANLHSLAHGVIRLEQVPAIYGKVRRRVRVLKMRCRDFRSGYHDFTIAHGGIKIFPRLVAAEHSIDLEDETSLRSGIDELDTMLGEGLDRGTSTLVIGPAGAGKTTLCMQYCITAIRNGEKALIVSFDETHRNFLRRGLGLGMDFAAAEKAGQFVFRQVDPAELSSGELSGIVRDHVAGGCSVIVIDSLSGYQHALPEEQFLILQMHELLTYLNQQNVASFVVVAQSGVVGAMQTPVDLTYLSDTVLMLRFFEAQGRLRRTLSVVKKRTGEHETTIRELVISPQGLNVSEPLIGFQGVLTGTPLMSSLS